MAFRPLYTISGSSPYTLGYDIAASEAFNKGDVVVLNSAGAVAEGASDAVDVLGVAMEDVVAGLALGPVTDRVIVCPFTYDIVWACNMPSDTDHIPLATDIGTINDLDLVSGDWGILQGTASTGSTPQFRIVDIDAVRLEFHVIIAPVDITDVYQWIDAAV